MVDAVLTLLDDAKCLVSANLYFYHLLYLVLMHPLHEVRVGGTRKHQFNLCIPTRINLSFCAAKFSLPKFFNVGSPTNFLSFKI